jgi:hypothetical protein
MQNLGATGEACPFSFNFDAKTFKVGDMVSYRIPDRFPDFPFVGTLAAVHKDYVEISANDPLNPTKLMKGTRESRPIVTSAEALSENSDA